MKRLATVCFVLSLLVVPAFAAGKPAPALRGEIYGLPLHGQQAGKALLFVIDGDVLSEYLLNGATNEIQLIGMGRIATDHLADGSRAIRFQDRDCSFKPGLENLVLTAHDEELELPGGGRLPYIRDLGAIAFDAPPSVVDRDGQGLRPAADASIYCCAACWGAHIGLSIGFMTDMTIFDPLCCLFGC